MVALRAEVQHGAAEQAELDADLDEQRQVGERERLEARDVAAEVVVAAVLLGVAGDRLVPLGQLLRPLQHLRAMLLERQVVAGRVAVPRDPLAHPLADLAVGPVEEALELGGVDARGGGGHGALVPRRG